MTPTYQSVLNRQLAKIMDAIDYGDLNTGYGMLKTLICSLNPKDSEHFLENDVKHIDSEIAKIMSRRTIDAYQTKRTQKWHVDNLLRSRMLPLFHQVMVRLHLGGYLEKQPIQPKAKGPGRLSIP